MTFGQRADKRESPAAPPRNLHAQLGRRSLEFGGARVGGGDDPKTLDLAGTVEDRAPAGHAGKKGVDTLKPGQSTFIKRGIVHAFRNDTQEATTCLCILTPGVLGPGYFREIAALVAGGAPDPAKMKEIMLRHGLVPAPQ